MSVCRIAKRILCIFWNRSGSQGANESSHPGSDGQSSAPFGIKGNQSYSGPFGRLEHSAANDQSSVGEPKRNGSRRRSLTSPASKSNDATGNSTQISENIGDARQAKVAHHISYQSNEDSSDGVPDVSDDTPSAAFSFSDKDLLDTFGNSAAYSGLGDGFPGNATADLSQRSGHAQGSYGSNLSRSGVDGGRNGSASSAVNMSSDSMKEFVKNMESMRIFWSWSEVRETATTAARVS